MRLPRFRLNGAPVLHYDGSPKLFNTLREIGEAIREDFDLSDVLKQATFTGPEQAYLRLTYLGTHTQREAGEQLRWTQQKTERIRRSCDRKLSKKPLKGKVFPTVIRQTATSYIDKLPSGARVWTLRDVSAEELRIIAKERIIFHSVSNIYEQKCSRAVRNK